MGVKFDERGVLEPTKAIVFKSIIQEYASSLTSDADLYCLQSNLKSIVGEVIFNRLMELNKNKAMSEPRLTMTHVDPFENG